MSPALQQPQLPVQQMCEERQTCLAVTGTGTDTARKEVQGTVLARHGRPRERAVVVPTGHRAAAGTPPRKESLVYGPKQDSKSCSESSGLRTNKQKSFVLLLFLF